MTNKNPVDLDQINREFDELRQMAIDKGDIATALKATDSKAKINNVSKTDDKKQTHFIISDREITIEEWEKTYCK